MYFVRVTKLDSFIHLSQRPTYHYILSVLLSGNIEQSHELHNYFFGNLPFDSVNLFQLLSVVKHNEIVTDFLRNKSVKLSKSQINNAKNIYRDRAIIDELVEMLPESQVNIINNVRLGERWYVMAFEGKIPLGGVIVFRKKQTLLLQNLVNFTDSDDENLYHILHMGILDISQETGILLLESNIPLPEFKKESKVYTRSLLDY